MKRCTPFIPISHLILIMLLLLPSLAFAAELTFDMASGKQTGFEVNARDSDFNPNNYPNKGEVWSYHGFIGRLDYRGEPAKVTITNTGLKRSSPHDTKFNFIYHTNTTINTGRYREFFIPQRSESSGSITMVPLPSECRESKVIYPAPWGGKGGNASWVQGLPWGIDTFHCSQTKGALPWRGAG